MFDPNKVETLSIPCWESVYRAEIAPGIIALVAIHDTSRGWALGGCRISAYDNEAAALTDVLRLSRGMTFKNAIAHLPLGGGKSVIVCDPTVSGDERTRVLEEFGKFVSWINRAGRRYCTAEDMNTTVADMHVMRRTTDDIYGLSADPSPYTAYGVFASIEYAASYFADDFFQGEPSLAGKSVLVQGLGKVGFALCEYLVDAGARVLVSDINLAAVARATARWPKVTVVQPEHVLATEVDIFAPCARGEVISQENIDHLKFKIVCGAANNQLQTNGAGKALQKRGIVYCPDYIANMGGVCCIQYVEIENHDHEAVLTKIRQTVDKVLDSTFRTAFEENLAFNVAVDRVTKDIVWNTGFKDPNISLAEIYPATHTRLMTAAV